MTHSRRLRIRSLARRAAQMLLAGASPRTACAWLDRQIARLR